MSYFEAILIVLLSALGTASLSLLVGRFVSVDRRRKHHEIGFQVFAMIGLMEYWDEHKPVRAPVPARA